MLDTRMDGRYRSRDDLLADCTLLEQSDIFDATAYRKAAGVAPEQSAAEHYLVQGWREDFEPGPNFHGSFLYPYFRTIGFAGPPAVTFINLEAAGWAVYPIRSQVEDIAAVLRASGFFDTNNYAARLGLPDGIDPALHYVIVGEQVGQAPSGHFDPIFYRRRYPDVVAARANCLFHYIANGRREGRRPVSTVSRLGFDASHLDPDRETVLVVSHEASRTGAPIVAYNIAAQLRQQYNVVSLLLEGGALVKEFSKCSAAVIGPLTYGDWHEAEAQRLVERLAAFGRVSYAIVNSIESRYFISSLVKAGIPVVLLVHEFASYTRPRGATSEALEWATQMVFSADMTANSALDELPTLSNRTIHILPQGRCVVPRAANAPVAAQEPAALKRKMRPQSAKDAMIVLGGGTIQYRKGVDLFLSCAAAVRALAPKRPVRFVWIGHGYDPVNDVVYSSYLAEQIARSGLEDMIAMLDEVPDLEPAYATAGLFFLSSRLDPLPNVTIDAVLHGLPVVCFEGGSGIAPILAADSELRGCVVPYLDVDAAARVIARFADDEDARLRIGRATRRLGKTMFDMKGYVSQIDELGQQAVDIMRQRMLDFVTLLDDPTFDPDIFLPLNSAVLDRADAINHFLTQWTAVGTSLHAVKNPRFRRPAPGFHPQIYAHENAGAFNSALVNPLADFIRRGKLDGPWCHTVIVPSDAAPAVSDATSSAALHVHFYYPELAGDFLQKLSTNRSRCDLLLTTTTEKDAESLRVAMSDYQRGAVMVEVVPNRGRDIGAFLSGFGRELIARYAVIGHLHSKRSLVLGNEVAGETWREFLWQNLVGGLYPMMDVVLARFADEPELGLVFPEDPHLPGWADNFEVASDLARRMGLEEPLGPFFEFPVGTMFWARPKALAPLLDLNLDWDDYPKEPLPYDGTMLHALERLLPFAARQAGYLYATTHIPGITR
jgi:glycosyltransferase involved in cell wall biosynthesis